MKPVRWEVPAPVLLGLLPCGYGESILPPYEYLWRPTTLWRGSRVDGTLVVALSHIFMVVGEAACAGRERAVPNPFLKKDWAQHTVDSGA